ncbi:MAG: tRNA 2-thiouridine(34) synthase MnmA [Candidatus Saccharibacteria bacterium]|nr:tRNA 2-thiouridine(34) synthase MnmA [Candidatus Saccharibacteria bacterium]
MDKDDFIFLDYASATPVDDRVFEKMKPFFSKNFFNPSSAYLSGKRVREIYETEKDELAHTIGAKGNDLVITAGATEANNLAFSALKNYQNVNCLILETEHASVREAAKAFCADVREIKVKKTGLIDLLDLKNKLDEKTVLVSVALANNELGTIQPLSEISEILKQEKQSRLKNGNETPLYLHSDASQGMNLIDLYISRLGVDLLTINSAKLYGPKGIGALYVGRGIKLSPVVYGGGQELGLRSGTENVPSLIGFSTAAKLAKEHVNGNRKKYEKLSNLFRETLISEAKKLDIKSELTFLGHKKHQLANFIPVCFNGIDAERLIYKLEQEKIYLSTGAACAASKGKKSHVLKAIGLSDSEIAGSLRISLGSLNDEKQIKTAAKKIIKAVKELETENNKTAQKKPVVYVGMSGGVDSSVSALLLKEQGYNVVGVYMKNWSRDLPGMKCPWAEDLADAKRVATKLGIEFKVFDFEKEYKQKVVDYMLEEFKKGNTPNPDIMCNQEIKFKLFYDIAREQGADFIATGHYANIANNKLAKAKDENKDQTYFLYRISEDAINHTLFPIGNMLKPDVKKLAEKNGLDNAYKKESMGICFVGDVGIKDFLKEYLKSEGDKKKYLKPGKIIERETKKVLGFHDGAIFYTIGQRHGLDVGGGLPFYVVGKDIEKNEVYVSKNLNNDNLWTKELKLKDVILRSSKPVSKVEVRLRHRAKLEEATFNQETNTLTFKNEVKRPANGQSAVIYNGDICLGGGIIVD